MARSVVVKKEFKDLNTNDQAVAIKEQQDLIEKLIRKATLGMSDEYALITTYLNQNRDRFKAALKLQFEILQYLSDGNSYSEVQKDIDPELTDFADWILTVRQYKDVWDKKTKTFDAIYTAWAKLQDMKLQCHNHNVIASNASPIPSMAELRAKKFNPKQYAKDERLPNPFDKLSEVYESTNDVIDLQSLPAQVILGNEIKDCLLTLVDEADSLYYCDLLQDHVVLDDQGNIAFKGQFIGNLVTSDALV